MSKDKKEKAEKINNLEDLRASVDKKVGDGSLMIGRRSIVSVDAIPTNVATIDYAIGCCGIPRGRIMEVFGPESSGKTTTCLQFAKSCQQYYISDKKRNGVVAFIDAEHALDLRWAANIGINVDNLLISQPDSGEAAFTIIEALVDSGLVDLIIVDSVAALVPQSIIEGGMDEANIGAQARLMSKALSKLRGKFNTNKTTAIFINQIREKIGVSFGSPEHTPGGRALKFYASIRMDIRHGERVKDGDKVVAATSKMKIVKNKVAPPFTSAEYKIGFGTEEYPVYGIDEIGTLFDVALAHKIIKQSGSHYKYGNEILGNGLCNAINATRNNSKICAKIKEEIYNKFALNVQSNGPVEESDDELLEDITSEQPVV